MEQPITGYRVFFENHWEDFPTADEAWRRRCEYLEQTGQAPYVHTLREGGSPAPEF